MEEGPRDTGGRIRAARPYETQHISFGKPLETMGRKARGYIAYLFPGKSGTGAARERRGQGPETIPVPVSAMLVRLHGKPLETMGRKTRGYREICG